MTKEEAKQRLRNQIDSSIKRQHEFNNDVYYLCYNKSYLRALKLSKIADKTVNKENFKGGEEFFSFNTKTKKFWYYPKISNYLRENYSKDFSKNCNLLIEVINEYEEYKHYIIC